MKPIRPLSAWAFPLLFAPLGAAAATYTVSAELSREGKVFSLPTLVLKEATPSTVSRDGKDGFAFTVEVRPGGGEVLMVSTRLETAQGAVIAPTLGVKPGRQASVSTGDLGIALTVVPGTR